MKHFISCTATNNGETGEIRVDAENQSFARANTDYDVWHFVSILHYP